MKRDFQKLARGPFDLLVVGGGIYGAWIAYDAALRGLEVALVERTDWAAGTSSASSKLIHGGLRYLEQFHVSLVRKSLAERKRLITLAPHRIHPLRFVIPVYRGDRLDPFRLKIGLLLYDLLVGAHRVVGRHGSLSREALLASSRFLSKDGLRCGFSYYDCATDDARYSLEIVAGAHEAGAVVLNRAEIVRLLMESGRVRGAVIRDRETDETLEVTAKLTVNCAGPWSPGVVPEKKTVEGLTRLTKGVHLVMPALRVEHAFLLTARSDGRVFFLIPWYGRTLLGTTDTAYAGDPDAIRVEPEDVSYLLTEANRVLGELQWSESDILGSYVGLRTLQNKPDASPSTVTREFVLEQPLPGLLMPVGGKYTSSRTDSAEAVDRVMELLGRPAARSPTEDRPFPWKPEGSFTEWLHGAVAQGVSLGLDRETAECCAYRFGARVEQVHDLVHDNPDLGSRIHPDLPFCKAEIVHAAEREMARTLEDVLRRRIPLTLLAPPDERRFTEAAELAGDALGWSAGRGKEEVASLMNRVQLFTGSAT